MDPFKHGLLAALVALVGWGAPPTLADADESQRQCCRLVPVAGAEVHSRFGGHAYAGAAVVTTEEVGMHHMRGVFAEAGYGLGGGLPW